MGIEAETLEQAIKILTASVKQQATAAATDHASDKSERRMETTRRL
jgi:hypothetical protein